MDLSTSRGRHRRAGTKTPDRRALTAIATVDITTSSNTDASHERPTATSRIVVALWVALGLALGSLGPSLGLLPDSILPASAATTEVDDEALFISLLNELRTERGLQPLTIDPELTREARQWTDQIRSNGQLSHSSDLSIGITATWLKLGENVGVGPEDRVQGIFDAFVDSPAHLANIVDPSFNLVGVGVLYDEDGRIWTAHRFMASDATTSASAPQDPAPETLALVDGASSASGVIPGDQLDQELVVALFELLS